MRDFVKLGDFYIPVDDIMYIKVIGCGCRIYLKTYCNDEGKPIELANLPEEDWNEFMKKYLGKKEVVITNE